MNTFEDWGIIALVGFTAIVVLLLAILTFHIVQSFNTIHFQAVNECVEMNKAANATVCLV